MSEINRESLPIRISKIIVKASGLLLVFGTIVFFLWRAFISTIVPAEVNGLAVNDILHDAWQTAETNEAGEKILTLYTQAQEGTTSAEKNYSYFSAMNATFIEEAEQVQVLFRYNNATLRHLKEDYGLPERPDRHGEYFDVTLVVAYDLTPDVTTDNLESHPDSVKLVRYHATTSETAETLLYNYRRLTFDGIDMTVTENPVLAVYLDVYYLEDLDYEEESYGTLCIYDFITEKKYIELSKKDQEALECYE